MTPARISMFVLTFLVTTSATAIAHDLFPPLWRGQPGSTFQEWTFDTDANPAAPTLLNNPYGAPAATITVGAFGAGWQQQLPGLGSQTGYWDIGDAIEGAQIVLDIPNRPVQDLYKEIWVQVTSYVDINQAPLVSVPGATLLGSDQAIVEQVPEGGSWVLDLTKWRIEPNPSQEQIVLSAIPMFGATIDQIVVDTICVPEPATLLTLVVGGIALLRRRGGVGT